MDVHIHMAYCTPCGFKLLAANYLGIKDHNFFKEIEELIDIANVTPIHLKGLINFLHKKMKEKEEDKAKKVEITQMKFVNEKKEINGNGI
ncbi:hypothetical protein H5410_014087 [Solanum commersonii]|uniref:AAA+ ATPase At3g28540-like C-terminal domain-containing protein n=1 Tax=Solanum commersonii TaxID=4109 RepID=A0A9J5ZQE6_SOLCO|nr:hypothetical protein H5410_014087 [Solanum commersonii]